MGDRAVSKYDTDEATFLRRLSENRVFDPGARQRLQEMAEAADKRKAAYVQWHLAVRQGIHAIDTAKVRETKAEKQLLIDAKKMLLSALYDAEKVLT